ncbi:hypothetical protein BH20ACI3_BH20ACI3_43090 [soil metagenome]
MGGITTILRYQWRAYLRRFTRAGNLTAGNQGILLILSGFILFRYFQLLGTATADLAAGKTAVLERLLTGIFLAWLFPLVSNVRLSISTRVLRHLPLSVKELFGIKAISLLMPPYAWMIVAGSLAICYPLMHAPSPLAGVSAALLFIVMSWLIGLTIAQLLSIAFWRKLLCAAAIGLLCAGGLYVISGKDPAGLSHFSSFLPANLVVRAAFTKQSCIAIGMLSVLMIIALCAALWSFRQSLEPTTSRRSQKNLNLMPFKFPGKTGGLLAKDFRYFRRLLDPYFGLLAAALCSFYLMTADNPSSDAFWVFIIIVFVPSTSVAFNCFGLDNRSGLDRYTLLPLNGREIMLSKNLAFIALICVQLLLMILPAGWRLGLGVAALGFVQAALLALAYMTWGNWMSVNHPFKMQFLRLSSGGSPIDVLGGAVFGSLPGFVAIKVFHENKPDVLWITILMLLLYGALYLCSVIWAGRSFERKRERIGVW